MSPRSHHPTLLPVKIRTEVIRAIRSFFEARYFQEVIPPTLNRSVPLEPTLYPFHTQWYRGDENLDLYLSISPERGMKKLLAQGIGDCFGIGKCFRNLESNGSRHNPEFLMLEWYRVGATYHQIMVDTQDLVQFVAKWIDEYLERPSSDTLQYGEVSLKLNTQWPVVSLAKLIEEKTGQRMAEICKDEVLPSIMVDKGYQVDNASWEQLFNQLVLNEVEGEFSDQPFFLVDFPARLSPLCALQPERPYLAQRFEVFMAGMEIGNGNTENTNAAAVQAAFEQEAKVRQQQGLDVPPIDTEFIQALSELEGRLYAGIGLGVDRLAMMMANADHISQVEPFAI